MGGRKDDEMEPYATPKTYSGSRFRSRHVEPNYPPFWTVILLGLLIVVLVVAVAVFSASMF